MIKEWCAKCKGSGLSITPMKQCGKCNGTGYTELEPVWNGQGKITILDDGMSKPAIFPFETIGKDLEVYFKESKSE